LLRRRCVSGRVLEVVIGHCAFCGLVVRKTFCVFHGVCRFIHAQYYDSADLAHCPLRAHHVPWRYVVPAGRLAETAESVCVRLGLNLATISG
jgi:hypothetical protein